MRLLLATLAALAPLCGCTTGSSITGESYSVFYRPELTRYVARDGVMPTVLYGYPYSAGSEDDLLARLSLPGGHAAARFATTEAAREGREGRLVLVFDPVMPPPGGQAVCRLPAGRPVAGAPAGNGRLHVLGSFCYGGDVASEAALSIPRPGTADDARLAASLNLLVARLLPVDDPNRSASCGAPC
jgi:hypothetical protein